MEIVPSREATQPRRYAPRNDRWRWCVERASMHPTGEIECRNDNRLLGLVDEATGNKGHVNNLCAPELLDGHGGGVGGPDDEVREFAFFN